MDARTGRRQKRISKKQEQRAAEDIGGRTQAASGATRLGGGADVRGSSLRIECKYTEKTVYSLKLEDLEKLRQQALKTLEAPVFQVCFVSRTEKDLYAIIPWVSTRTAGCTFESAGKSMRLIQDLMKHQLITRKVRICLDFQKMGKKFELLRWSDFLKDLQGEQNFSMGCKVAETPCALCNGTGVCVHVEAKGPRT